MYARISLFTWRDDCQLHCSATSSASVCVRVYVARSLRPFCSIRIDIFLLLFNLTWDAYWSRTWLLGKSFSIIILRKRETIFERGSVVNVKSEIDAACSLFRVQSFCPNRAKWKIQRTEKESSPNPSIRRLRIFNRFDFIWIWSAFSFFIEQSSIRVFWPFHCV